MKPSEIVAALNALIRQIEGAQAQRAPASAGAARNSTVGDEFVDGAVAFWDVKETKTGKPYASLKLQDGQRWFCFDEAVLKRVDPLNRGEKVIVQLRERVNKEGDKQMLIVGLARAAAPAKSGITDDEIPF